MSNDDNAPADADSSQNASDEAKRDFKAERDAATKAVIDNMARLRALRLAKEAAEPARPTAAAKKSRAKPAKKSAAKSPALSDWLAGQQNGGHRT